jgi:hypothetical protein
MATNATHVRLYAHDARAARHEMPSGHITRRMKCATPGARVPVIDIHASGEAELARGNYGCVVVVHGDLSSHS